MKIKIQCPCGTRYAFEVEPVNHRMPVPVNCPSCGEDGTELANASIRQQLAQAPAPKPPPEVRIVRPGPPPTPPPTVSPPPPAARITPPSATASPRLRIARETPAPEPAPAASAEPPGTTPAESAVATPPPTARFCPKHLTEPATETCLVCGKPMCPKCMELFGYVCSVYCRELAEKKKIKLPAYARQRSVVEGKARARSQRTLALVAAAAVGLLSVWVWYEFFGSKPRVIYSAKLTPAERDTVFQLVGPNELLSLNGAQMTLRDVKRDEELWSVTLNLGSASDAAPVTTAVRIPAQVGAPPDPDEDDPGAGARVVPFSVPAGFLDDELRRKPSLVVTKDDLWVLSASRALRLDRHTGARKDEVSFKTPVTSVTHNDAAILVVSEPAPDRRTLTRIALPDGAVQTEELTLPAAARSSPGAGSRRTSPGPAFRGASLAAAGDTRPFHDQVIVSDPTVVLFSARLLEHRVEVREGIKPKTKSVMEGNLTAVQTIEAAEELLNDMKRQDTGGRVEVDVSRYRVTLRRWFANNAPDWTSEVVGPPAFFPLRTVDALVAGQTLYAFDKQNKKLWESKLTYPIASFRELDFDEAGERVSPCLETGDALYLFDQGMLTRFDLDTGNVRWRLSSVGISRVQVDDRGKLYVCTTTASPENIQYAQQIKLLDRPQPVIMKVDPATGKVYWKLERAATDCLLTGKYVYAARLSSGPFSPMISAWGSGDNFNLFRLKPSNGKRLWHLHQSKWPRQLDAEQNSIMLRFDDEVQVLKFLAL